MLWMTQYLCCSLNVMKVTDHGFKRLEQCRSITNLLCQKPCQCACVRVCVCVCVFVVRLAVNADGILSIWLKPSHAADFVCYRVCVRGCVSVCDWWAVGLLLECVLMFNVICVCCITVCLDFAYISLSRACKQNQIKKHLLSEVHISIHHSSISQQLIEVRVAAATGKQISCKTVFQCEKVLLQCDR